jgi:hypothetical protein
VTAEVLQLQGLSPRDAADMVNLAPAALLRSSVPEHLREMAVPPDALLRAPNQKENVVKFRC